MCYCLLGASKKPQRTIVTSEFKQDISFSLLSRIIFFFGKELRLCSQSRIARTQLLSFNWHDSIICKASSKHLLSQTNGYVKVCQEIEFDHIKTQFRAYPWHFVCSFMEHCILHSTLHCLFRPEKKEKKSMVSVQA